jgi:hypothetical protein
VRDSDRPFHLLPLEHELDRAEMGEIDALRIELFKRDPISCHAVPMAGRSRALIGLRVVPSSSQMSGFSPPASPFIPGLSLLKPVA